MKHLDEYDKTAVLREVGFKFAVADVMEKFTDLNLAVIGHSLIAAGNECIAAAYLPLANPPQPDYATVAHAVAEALRADPAIKDMLRELESE